MEFKKTHGKDTAAKKKKYGEDTQKKGYEKEDAKVAATTKNKHDDEAKLGGKKATAQIKTRLSKLGLDFK